MNEIYIFSSVSILIVIMVFFAIKFQPNEYLKTYYLMNLVEVIFTISYISIWIFICLTSKREDPTNKLFMIYAGIALIFFWIPSFLVIQIFMKMKGNQWWADFKNQSQNFPVKIGYGGSTTNAKAIQFSRKAFVLTAIFGIALVVYGIFKNH